MNNVELFPEDLSELKHASPIGPLWRVERVIHEYLESVVRTIVEKINNVCSLVLQDAKEFDGVDYSGYEYACRNGFEWVCLLRHGEYRDEDILPLDILPNEWMDRIECEIKEICDASVCEMCKDRVSARVIVAWFWEHLNARKADVDSSRRDEMDTFEACKAIVMEIVEDQMVSTCCWIEERIDEKHAADEVAREEEFKKNWEYDEDEDLDMLNLLRKMAEVLRECGRDDESYELTPVIKFVEKFLVKALSDKDEHQRFDFYINEDNGHGFDSVSFSVSANRLSMECGGYFASDAGGDSYGDEVWVLNRWEHAWSKGSAWGALTMLKHGCVIQGL